MIQIFVVINIWSLTFVIIANIMHINMHEITWILVSVYDKKFNKPQTYLPPFVIIYAQSTENQETIQTIRRK